MSQRGSPGKQDLEGTQGCNRADRGSAAITRRCRLHPAAESAPSALPAWQATRDGAAGGEPGFGALCGAVRQLRGLSILGISASSVSEHPQGLSIPGG